jgi:hypothetical protein
MEDRCKYFYNIEREIFIFESTYNKSPEAIIMSYGLYSLLQLDTRRYMMYDCTVSSGYGTYCGIPIEVYRHDGLSYYLAESKFDLD